MTKSCERCGAVPRDYQLLDYCATCFKKTCAAAAGRKDAAARCRRETPLWRFAMLMKTELLPCPLCGGEPKVKDIKHHYWNVCIECQRCWCKTGEYNNASHFADMVKCWNRRPETNAAPQDKTLSGVCPEPAVAATAQEQLTFMSRQAELLDEQGHDVSANVMRDCMKVLARTMQERDQQTRFKYEANLRADAAEEKLKTRLPEGLRKLAERCRPAVAHDARLRERDVNSDKYAPHYKATLQAEAERAGKLLDDIDSILKETV